MGQGESPATPADPLVQRQGVSCQTSDRKSWQENAGRRWQNLVDPGGQVERDGVNATSQLPCVAASTYLHPQEQWPEASARNSPHALQIDAGTVEAGSGTCFRKLGGSKLLWVLAQPFDCRRHRILFHHAVQTYVASVGT